MNCQFDSCRAKMDGGAIYWSGSSGKIDNSKFTSCKAFEAGGASGGAVMMRGDYSTIQNSIFDSNTGQNGGGLRVYGIAPILDNLTFINNHAISRGGGLYVDGGSCDVTNCKFINNTAEGRGGGALFDAYAQWLSDLTFVNNSAALGGGLVFKSWSGGYLFDSEFYNNHASYGGGALIEQGTTGLFMNLFVTFKATKSCDLVNVITSGNKTANDTVEVNKPQYEIEKIALNKTVYFGEQVIFEIVVHNSGKLQLIILSLLSLHSSV